MEKSSAHQIIPVVFSLLIGWLIIFGDIDFFINNQSNGPPVLWWGYCGGPHCGLYYAYFTVAWLLKIPISYYSFSNCTTSRLFAQ